ncbi:MAG: helix-turn-helix domain-containing protein [Proteobacteria bacterium]|nr:helix-turn-helix domain-containing protein [Desulfobacula sp.]MBU4132766.1 helix-turn-helix domain-containing protein [Pseudomonadota bacterium]
MKKISILILEQSLPSGIVSFADVFKMAGAAWDKSKGFTVNPLFDVEIVSIDGKPIRYSRYLEIKPNKSISEVESTDLILVPSSGYDIASLGSYPRVLTDWVADHHERATQIAGGCTGVFLLAEAGILNGRTATTHWGYADLFRKRYPGVRINPEKILTRDGNVFCSGGGSAGIDLCLYLIEQECGAKVANRCAKILLLERGRDIQPSFAGFHPRKKHGDSEIVTAQTWIEAHSSHNFCMADVASRVGMSLRNFKRRFKNATGESPLVYMQKLRMEAAKNMLEKKRTGIEEIANQVGYDDIGFFRKVFARYVGVSPSIYRQKFYGQSIWHKGIRDL